MEDTIPASLKRQAFDNVRFICPHCGIPGLIRSVALNATYVVVYGLCVVCLTNCVKTFDLLRIDHWLNDPECTSPEGCEECDRHR